MFNIPPFLDHEELASHIYIMHKIYVGDILNSTKTKPRDKLKELLICHHHAHERMTEHTIPHRHSERKAQ
jgi:hypothetical protein